MIHNPVDIPDILSVVSFDPPTPDDSDSDDWALAVARKLRALYRAHGRVPFLVWPDPEAPGVSVVGKKTTVDVKSKTAVNSSSIE